MAAVYDLPVLVEDAENIVRAVKTPYHIKKGKLLGNAFRPPKGVRAVSVIRELMGLDFCELKGREICGDSFIGMAIVNVGGLRGLGDIDVTDERAEFLGHAHINYRQMADADNPSADLIPLFKKIAAMAQYIPNTPLSG